MGQVHPQLIEQHAAVGLEDHHLGTERGPVRLGRASGKGGGDGGRRERHPRSSACLPAAPLSSGRSPCRWRRRGPARPGGHRSRGGRPAEDRGAVRPGWAGLGLGSGPPTGAGAAAHLGQHVVAVSVEGVLLPVEGGDVGAALQGAAPGARQVFAHPAAGVADAVGQRAQVRLGTSRPWPSPALTTARQPQPGPAPYSPVLAVVADLLAGSVQLPVQLAVALAHGDAATVPEVVVHGAWDSG